MAKKSKVTNVDEVNEATVSGEDTTSAAAEGGEKVRKSIVPNKYGNKYRKGGTDELAEFINKQCNTDDGFSFDNFFALCRANGVDEAKVAHYAGQVAEKRHGSQGRARMTLRNCLATFVRKKGELVGLDGASVSLTVAALPVRAPAAEQTAEAA